VKLLVTCEHGGNRIPARYRTLFGPLRAALSSHRGYDPGALVLARDLANAFDAELVYSTTSRLLVELNRSAGNPLLWSEATRALPFEERKRILDEHYTPYRSAVEASVRSAIGRGDRVLHVSSHSFTPRLDGAERKADVGLLYDPARRREVAICLDWQRELRRASPRLRVRRNYPYRGSDDGLTTHLRRLHPDARYAGVEVEVNQAYPLGNAAEWRALRRLIVETLGRVIARAARTRR
jgi:predicted N-formylglutamate amidohydrolase